MKFQNQKIITHPWLGKDAIEAVRFYCSVFPGSKKSPAAPELTITQKSLP